MGFLAAAPFLVKSLSGPIGGVTADLLRRRYLSTRTVRRLYFGVGKCSELVVILTSQNSMYSYKSTDKFIIRRRITKWKVKVELLANK